MEHFSVDVGYIDAPGSTVITAYGIQGSEIISVPIDANGIGTVNVSASGIASFRVMTTGSEPNGWALDNLTFIRGGGAPAVNPKYVALGDSFQSGEGTKYGPDGIIRSYIAGTDTFTNQCHRSDWAYPSLLVSRGVVPSEWEFRACSGAVIDDLYASEVRPAPPYDDRKAQLDALSAETEIVTIGIVGNDLGFAPVIADCIDTSLGEMLYPSFRSCEQDQGQIVRDRLDRLARTELHDKLLQTYRDIRERAPHARVVVISYPEFFPPNGADPACGLVFRPSDQIWMNRAIEEAGNVLDAVAREGGFEYVNMYGVLAGHEQCAVEEGLNGVKVSGSAPEAESYHPNRLGHELMADRIQSHLGTSTAPTHRITPGATLTERFVVGGVRATVNVAWPGSDVVTTLISPSGHRYTRDDSTGADRGNGPTWEYYTIDDPEPGEWTVEMFGADVAPDGEPVTLSVTDVPPLNEHPEASLTVTQVDADTFKFDGTTSSDPDGNVREHRWDFGDGTPLVSGAVVEHTFAPGEYQVALVVTDDDGSLGFATTEPHIVVGDPRTGGAALTTHSATEFTNAMTVQGDVRIAGDFECNTQSHIHGALIATGSVHLTNTCRVDGGVTAGGDVRLDSTPLVEGGVISGGTVRMQSTATVHGGVTTADDFVVIDGRSVEQLRASNSLTGDVRTGAAVVAPSIAPNTVDGVVGVATTWRQWVNSVAASNAAPSWSQGLSSNPGCVIAPWANSVNGNTIEVATPLVVDATASRSGCGAVRLQGMTIRQSADLVFYTDSLTSVNGLNVVSADGLAHRLAIITPGEGTCGSRDISLGAGTVVDPLISVALRAQGRVSVHGTSTLAGDIVSRCFSSSGQVGVGSH